MAADEWASESKLAEALAEIILKCQEFQIDLLLIGAFAVRAYAIRQRLTTDLDFVAPRSTQSSLAALFKSLGYDYSARTRFGGVRGVKYVDGRKIQLDVDIDAIRDENSGSVYVIPEESFRQRFRVKIAPLANEAGVEAYVVPLADLLILKLMAGRDQDAADAAALILTDAFSDAVTVFKRKARDAGLVVRVNTRLGEMLSLNDRGIQNLMSGHTGGRLSLFEVGLLRRRLRDLRI